MSLGFEAEGFRTVAFCERSKFKRRVLSLRFPGVPILEDLETADFRPYRGIDALTAGWPCQDISIAGNGAGLAGARSGLWRHVKRAVAESEPLVCFFENSPMLRSRGYATVKLDMEGLGYRIRPFVVDARVLGSDQGRTRVYLVAHFVRERAPGQFQGFHLGENGQGRARGTPDLCATGWRTGPLLDRQPESILCRNTDGIPDRLDRLHALGDAVMPGVVRIFARAIYQQLRNSNPTKGSDAQ